MKNAICLLTLNPSSKIIYLDFINQFVMYDIYVMIDDNTFNCSDLRNTYKNINFIQIDNNICNMYGFKNLTYITIYKEITSWEKSIYFFSYLNNNYSNVWIFEDDVYFFSEDTLLQIDKKYGEKDILCNSSYDEGKLDEWHWNRIRINFNPPYYSGMMCAIRLSNKYFNYIKKYAKNNNTLFFLEAFFPTIAKKYNLDIVISPAEFKNITFEQEFLDYSNKNVLYHPVKNILKHNELRLNNNFKIISYNQYLLNFNNKL